MALVRGCVCVCVCVYLVVLDGPGQGLHIDRLVQLVLVQQVDEQVQRALVNTHLRVQSPHPLIHLHTAAAQGSAGAGGTVIVVQ